MKVIINDFSLDGQFKEFDDFIDSLYDNTIPMLSVLEDLGIEILSSYDSYQLKITDEKKLCDILRMKGIPEITKLKVKLQKLFFDEPFWDYEPQCEDAIYQCEYTIKVTNYCLAEALERKVPVISLEHNKFKETALIVKKYNFEHIIKNLFDKESTINIFREEKILTHFKYLMLKHKLKDSFGLSLKRNYFEELICEANLLDDDIESIVNDLEILIYRMEKGEDLGRFSKTIDGKLKEFRTSLTNNRQIRIFYFEKLKKPVFLNGFLKKTQKTPPNEIDKAKGLMEKMLLRKI